MEKCGAGMEKCVMKREVGEVFNREGLWRSV